MDDQLEISETNKEKNHIIVNRKYKFNLWYITSKTKVFKCTEYKTIKKCKSYIICIFNNNNYLFDNNYFILFYFNIYYYNYNYNTLIHIKFI